MAASVPAGTASRAQVLAWAEQTYISECMAHFGFKYIVLGWQNATESTSVPPSPYQSPSAQNSRIAGYGLSSKQSSPDEPTEADNPNYRYYQTLSMADRAHYDAVLNGTHQHLISITIVNGVRASLPTDGCTSAARTALYGDLAEWWRLHTTLTNLALLITPAVERDPTYRRSLAAWQACMARSGHPASTPMAARAAAGNGYRTSTATAARASEIAIATADASCSNASKLAVVANRVYTRAAATVSRQHITDQAQYQRLLAAAMTRAQGLIKQASSAQAGH